MCGDRGILVDTGTPTFPTRIFQPYMHEHGLPLKGVTLAVDTHCHWDHTGGNAAIRELTGARLAAHSADADLIHHPRWFIAANAIRFGTLYPLRDIDDAGIRARFGPPAPLDERLADGQTIDLGTRTLHVIHAPGHSWGHIALWDESNGLLLTGDAVQGWGTRLDGGGRQGTGIAFYADLDAYRATVRKLAALQPQVVILGHAFLPHADSIIRGPATRQFFRDSLDFMTALDDCLLDILSDGSEYTLAGLGDLVCRRFGHPHRSFQALVTIQTHLESLKRERRVASGPGPASVAAWSSYVR